MTNYYNILGLEQDADLKSIKLAYRKLSKKFHPDVNRGDSFFDKMFLQIQEAYEVLSDTQLRNRYDLILNSAYQNKTLNEREVSTTPIIENFSVNKQSVARNEDFTVTWKVKNADFVQIRPLGVFPSEGFSSFKFDKLKGESVNLVIIATNSLVGTSARKSIEIFNKNWKPSFFEDEVKTDITIKVLRVLIVLVILAFILAIIFVGVEVEDPLRNFKK